MMRIKKNDSVLVISGKNRGKRGKVHRVLPTESRVLVESVNIVKRHAKPRGVARQAGIIEQEAPIHISNVKLICTKCDKPTRVGFSALETGVKVRVCRSCGEVID